MQDFIRDAAAKLGIGEDQAAGATGGLLDLVKQYADPGDMSEMLQKVPGAADLMGKGDSGGGGGLLGALGSALGGDTGKALGAVDMLQKTGLDLDKLGGLADMFKQYIEPLLGSDLLKSLLAKVPALTDLLK
ncbi:MAG: DUF2780 domain-containing protein [Planctomycetota bacterium]|nr:DUF2780 domain-containing protein [Planctomycetota bacterium]